MFSEGTSFFHSYLAYRTGFSLSVQLAVSPPVDAHMQSWQGRKQHASPYLKGSNFISKSSPLG